VRTAGETRRTIFGPHPEGGRRPRLEGWPQARRGVTLTPGAGMTARRLSC